MNTIVDTVNVWGTSVLRQAWPTLWQSSLLVGVVLVIDLVTRRRLRPAIRYALWLVVLLKLVLPPSLALPSGVGWWLRPAAAPPSTQVRATYAETPAAAPMTPVYSTAELSGVVPPTPQRWPVPALASVTWVSVSLGLLGWMLVRWWQSARDVRRAAPAADELLQLLEQAKRMANLRSVVRLRVTERLLSPVVYGWFRPVVVLPRTLIERLSASQLRAVLLHELFHIRRADVWVNCVQALLQVLYWWHPLLWLANSRLRRLREEAVDDSVMLALRDEAENYAPTLLEVAKLALRRPLAALGLVGILESRSSLRQRVERLLDYHAPRKAGLTIGAVFSVIAFAALAVPMGQAPAGSSAGGTAIEGSAAAAPPLAANSDAGPKAGNALPTTNAPPLYTRVFKVDASFLSSLSPAKPANVTNELGHEALTQALRALFARLGVDTLQPPKAIFYTLGEQTLFVKATLPELDQIEKALAKVTTLSEVTDAPPQIHIRTRFIEVPEDVLTNSDWRASNSGGGGNPASPAILTSLRARAVLKTIQENPDCKLLSEGAVTTLSGRQVQLQTVDLQTIVTGIAPRALTPPGVTGGGQYVITTNFPFGPTIDLFAYVTNGGYAVHLTLMPSLVEFLGYDEPTNAVTIYVDGQEQKTTFPQPHLRIRSLTNSATVGDGQTLVVGDLSSKGIAFTDADWSPPKQASTRDSASPPGATSPGQSKHLLVFVTPTLIDPAGNRLHPDDEVPPPAR